MRPLPAMPPAAAAAMLRQLRHRGFAAVSLQPTLRPWIRDALHAAVTHDAAAMDEFRFPPLEGPIVYDEGRRGAFRALFEVATHCLGGVLRSLDLRGENDGGSENPKLHRNGRAFNEALQRMRTGEEGPRLFAANPNEPFEPGAPFSQSFFNLFNYNEGSLNSHVDRSLLTVIYSTAPAIQPSPDDAVHHRSALWVKDAEGTWHDADRAVGQDEVVILAGEDLEAAGVAAPLGLCAAEHAVRVDPTGPRIERSHFRRDPSCTADGAGNRTSAAMILRHEL